MQNEDDIKATMSPEEFEQWRSKGSAGLKALYYHVKSQIITLASNLFPEDNESDEHFTARKSMINSYWLGADNAYLESDFRAFGEIQVAVMAQVSSNNYRLILGNNIPIVGKFTDEMYEELMFNNRTVTLSFADEFTQLVKIDPRYDIPIPPLMVRKLKKEDQQALNEAIASEEIKEHAPILQECLLRFNVVYDGCAQYTKEEIEALVSAYFEASDSDSIFGYTFSSVFSPTDVDLINSPEFSDKRASFRIDNLQIDDDGLYGDIVVFKTPDGDSFNQAWTAAPADKKRLAMRGADSDDTMTYSGKIVKLASIDLLVQYT